MHRLEWSPGEKRAARSAFKAALARECATIRHEVEAMLKRSSDPMEIWSVHDYLSRKRRQIDQKYDYRYSVLTSVLGQLLAEGWVAETEIATLKPEKIEQIKRYASAWT
jgi:photoprotection regulator FRP-like protein